MRLYETLPPAKCLTGEDCSYISEMTLQDIKRHVIPPIIEQFKAQVHTLSCRLTNDAFGPFKAARPRRVVVTGMGLVTPIGLGVGAAWESLTDGACGIKAISADDIPKVGQRGSC